MDEENPHPGQRTGQIHYRSGEALHKKSNAKGVCQFQPSVSNPGITRVPPDELCKSSPTPTELSISGNQHSPRVEATLGSNLRTPLEFQCRSYTHQIFTETLSPLARPSSWSGRRCNSRAQQTPVSHTADYGRASGVFGGADVCSGLVGFTHYCAVILDLPTRSIDHGNDLMRSARYQ
jgi:hypothetical protein